MQARAASLGRRNHLAQGCQAFAELVGDRARLGGAADDARGDQHQELGALRFLPGGLEQIAQQRDVLQNRNAVDRLFGAFELFAQQASTWTFDPSSSW